MTAKAPTTKATTLGMILPDAVYPLATFMALTGLSRSAVREMRRNGFKVLRASKRGFVRGRDFLEFLTAQDAESPAHFATTGGNPGEVAKVIAHPKGNRNGL